MAARCYLRLTAGDLGQGAAEMHCRRVRADLSRPGDRSSQSPVDLADARPVAEPAKSRRGDRRRHRPGGRRAVGDLGRDEARMNPADDIEETAPGLAGERTERLETSNGFA